MASDRRDKLVKTAQRLFYQNGIHATGIDKILAEAGVAKMTLYKYFKSKDELILAALRRHDEEYRNFLMRSVEQKGNTPRERLLSLFDALDEWCAQDVFVGCFFVNASAEYSSHGNPIHAFAAEHNRLVQSYVRGLAAGAGADDPDELADHIFLLMEGVLVATHISGNNKFPQKARQAAELLIKSALDKKTGAA